MSEMLSPKLRRSNPGLLWHWCPGCSERHPVHVGGDHRGPKWQWDGSTEAPTFAPSLKHDFGDGRICHYFITGGLIQFCSDSTHALAGQIVPLPDFPEGQ
jgi:hypothetical protein